MFLSSWCFAGGLSYFQKQELKDQGYTSSDIRKIENGQTNVEPTYKYKSTTGNRYKYDLSKPGDQIKYELDLDAQMKDSLRIPVNPSVEIDRDIGQHGGGLMD